MSYLAASGVHHELIYVESDLDGLDALDLTASSGDAMKEIRRRVDDEGFTVMSETPTLDGIEDGFAFIGPEGFAFEIRRVREVTLEQL